MSLKDKLEEEQSVREIFQEMKELNRLMTSYIRVHMKEETVQEMTIENQLERIRENSDQIIQNMESVLNEQKHMLREHEEKMQANNERITRIINENQQSMKLRD